MCVPAVAACPPSAFTLPLHPSNLTCRRWPGFASPRVHQLLAASAHHSPPRSIHQSPPATTDALLTAPSPLSISTPPATADADLDFLLDDLAAPMREAPPPVVVRRAAPRCAACRLHVQAGGHGQRRLHARARRPSAAHPPRLLPLLPVHPAGAAARRRAAAVDARKRAHPPAGGGRPLLRGGLHRHRGGELAWQHLALVSQPGLQQACALRLLPHAAQPMRCCASGHPCHHTPHPAHPPTRPLDRCCPPASIGERPQRAQPTRACRSLRSEAPPWCSIAPPGRWAAPGSRRPRAPRPRRPPPSRPPPQAHPARARWQQRPPQAAPHARRRRRPRALQHQSRQVPKKGARARLRLRPRMQRRLRRRRQLRRQPMLCWTIW